MKKKWIILALLATASAAAAFYFLNREEKLPQAQAVAVASGSYSETVSSIGYVAYDREITLKSEVGGRLLTLNAERSDMVNLGDMLVALDDSEARLTYESLQDELNLAQARFDDYLSQYSTQKKSVLTQKSLLDKEIETQQLVRSQLISEMDRTKLLVDSDLATPSELSVLEDKLALQDKTIESLSLQKSTLSDPAYADDELKASIAQYDNKIKKQLLQLTKYQIAAPFSGLVTDVFVTVGDTVAAGQDLMTIASVDQKYILVDIDEKYLSRISLDQEVALYLDAYPDNAYKGTIAEILPTADSDTGTFSARVKILETPERFLKNMSVRVDLTTVSYENAIVIPGDYLIPGNEPAVYGVDGSGFVSLLPVEVYNRNLPRVMITKGLSEGDRILLPGDFAAGDQVAVIEKGDGE